MIIILSQKAQVFTYLQTFLHRLASLFTRIEVFHDHHFHITFSFHDELIREAAHG